MKLIIWFLILLLWGMCLAILFAPLDHIQYARAESIPDIVERVAYQYKVSPKKMLKVMKCESNLNPNAELHTKWEDSIGISQINLKAHKDVTLEQAKDPEFAATFMAKEFSKGNSKIWTCARI